jgi:hypothetical protein
MSASRQTTSRGRFVDAGSVQTGVFTLYLFAREKNMLSSNRDVSAARVGYEVVDQRDKCLSFVRGRLGRPAPGVRRSSGFGRVGRAHAVNSCRGERRAQPVRVLAEVGRGGHDRDDLRDGFRPGAVCRPGLCSCAHRYRPRKDLLVPARTIRTDTSERTCSTATDCSGSSTGRFASNACCPSTTPHPSRAHVVAQTTPGP